MLKNLNNFSKSTHGPVRNTAHTMSIKSCGVPSNSHKSNVHFVRNSLQLQSRDFEQLCEFMMRINPLYESSEGNFVGRKSNCSILSKFCVLFI